ncbi:MAG: glycosyltransferase [Anaerolineae bacterium]|nr:glycosyltransferase [Anaerolineae bacterium]
MSTIRVLYVDMALALGGSVTSIYRLVSDLDRSRYEAAICFYHDNALVPSFRALGATVTVLNAADRPAPSQKMAREHPVPARPQRRGIRRQAGALRRNLTFVLPMARRLCRLIRETRSDLVHANNALMENREVVLAARWAGVPCVCHVRRFQRVGLFDRWLARGAAAHLYISQAVATDYRQQEVRPRRSSVIYDGLPPEAFAIPDERLAVRAEFNIAPEAPLVGLVGRLTAWKGQDLFLRAIAAARGEVPGLRALIIGEGGPGDEAFVAHLHRMAVELGLMDTVVFAGLRSDMTRLFSALDVLAHTSVEPEPFGLVIIEGMAAGLPVIATGAGGAAETVEDGVSGLLVPRGDVTALARAIVHLASNRAQAAALGRAARRQAQDIFTVDRFVQGVSDLYHDVLPVN